MNMPVLESLIKKDKNMLSGTLPGFEEIHRYWDAKLGCVTAKILPGQFYVCAGNEVIATVLGSCVSACVRDTHIGVGGMNHFMLPTGVGSEADAGIHQFDEAARYGSFAMELLINAILKNGGKRRNLEVKVVGGGKVLPNLSDVGSSNITFVRRYLNTEGLPIVAEDLGDICPRKVLYYPQSGKLMVKKLRSLHNDSIVGREKEYIKELNSAPGRGDVELF